MRKSSVDSDVLLPQHLVDLFKVSQHKLIRTWLQNSTSDQRKEFFQTMAALYSVISNDFDPPATQQDSSEPSNTNKIMFIDSLRNSFSDRPPSPLEATTAYPSLSTSVFAPYDSYPQLSKLYYRTENQEYGRTIQLKQDQEKLSRAKEEEKHIAQVNMPVMILIISILRIHGQYC